MIQYPRRVHNQLINIEIFAFQLQFLLPVLLPRCRCQFQFCVIIFQKKALFGSLPSSPQAWGARQLGLPWRFRFAINPNVWTKQLPCHSPCSRLALFLPRTTHATYLLTFPAEVPHIPSNRCALMLVAALSLSTSAANWFMYSSCLL